MDLTILLGLMIVAISLLAEVIHRLDDRRSLLGELLREDWSRPHVAAVFEAAKRVDSHRDLPGEHRARVRQELQAALDRCARDLRPIARGELTWDCAEPGYAPEVIGEALGIVFLGEALSGGAILGCALIAGALVVASGDATTTLDPAPRGDPPG